MIELSKGGAYLVDGVDVIEESVAQHRSPTSCAARKIYRQSVWTIPRWMPSTCSRKSIWAAS